MVDVEGPRAPTPGEIPSLLQFLNSTLRKNINWSIADEYPTTYDFENRQNLRIIKRGDEVLSHAAVKSLIIKSTVGLLKVAAIGGVVTSEGHRQKGFSRKVLEDCIALATQQNHDIAILWTNLYELYRKLGFELAGSEISLIIDKEIPSEKRLPLRILKGANVSASAIEKLYNQHTINSVRKTTDFEKYLKIPNSSIYTAWTAENQIVAYAVEGKGADLNGYIHEWGGGVNELVDLFNFIVRDQKRPLTLMCPSHSQNLLRRLEPATSYIHNGFLGMIKILNSKNVIDKIQQQLRRSGLDSPDWQKTFSENLSESQKVRLLFGPIDSQIISKFDDKTKETLTRVLPLPIWIWGWDSI